VSNAGHTNLPGWAVDSAAAQPQDQGHRFPPQESPPNVELGPFPRSIRPAAGGPVMTMHQLDGTMDQPEYERLRDLRAATMLRLCADRIHREYLARTLDEGTAQDVDQAVSMLSRLGSEVARDRAGWVVAAGVSGLADALDDDDHNKGQRHIADAAPTMVAMAILLGWEVGSLNPF
jgi:hypothetical protein